MWGTGDVHTEFGGGKKDEKRPLGRPKHRREANIKRRFQEVKVWSMNWIDLAQDGDSWGQLVDVVITLQVS